LLIPQERAKYRELCNTNVDKRGKQAILAALCLHQTAAFFPFHSYDRTFIVWQHFCFTIPGYSINR
jgi:hypothetical protein